MIAFFLLIIVVLLNKFISIFLNKNSDYSVLYCGLGSWIFECFFSFLLVVVIIFFVYNV